MSEQSHLSDLGYEGQFGLERRGYNRMQVDETIAQLRLEVRAHEDGRRDLEDRLSRALDEIERLKLELSTARSGDRPAHEEISERIGQILKLAEDEAQAQRARADDEIAQLRAEAEAETGRLRSEVRAETDKYRAEAQEQAERMLSAAQQQADSTTKRAADEAQRLVADASNQAEAALASAKSEARQQLDDATARATAIHDGAERRLNLLMARHTEAVRRLTEIRDVVTTLVAGEADRGSLEEEVARIVASSAGGGPGAGGSRPATSPATGLAGSTSPRSTGNVASTRSASPSRAVPGNGESSGNVRITGPDAAAAGASTVVVPLPDGSQGHPDEDAPPNVQHS